MLRLLTALSLLVCSLAAAHQVPNITAEALFRSDGGYTLKISLDPRVFLSAQPTSLPPVPAEWFTQQTESEVTETWTRAETYLRQNFHLRFDGAESELPPPVFAPMDGATNAPITDSTAEVHILATHEGRLPESPASPLPFELAFGTEANTSLILLNSVDAKPERRPQVLFPGETSRPFQIATIAATTEPASPSEPEAQPSLAEREKQHEAFIARSRWWVLASAILLGLILKRLLFPKEPS